MTERKKRGAFHLARQIFDSEIWLLKPATWFKIWIYIIGKVNYKDNGTFNRGENFFRFTKELDNIGTDVTIDVVKKCLSFLRKSGMISTKRSTRGILLKVHNYRHFQDLSSYSGTKPSTKKALRKHEESTTIIKEGKNVIKKEVISTHKKFVKPTEKQIKDYCAKMSYNINAEKFIAHYDSIGWKRGKTPMKSWEATLTTWHLRDKDKKPKIESRQVKWFVYWCYHCNDEYFKKELGNYRCKHNNCQVEMKGDATVGVKLDHTRTIYKEEL